jgi:hypothetical protein
VGAQQTGPDTNAAFHQGKCCLGAVYSQPQRDSNPCLHLERVVSLASRRWGRVLDVSRPTATSRSDARGWGRFIVAFRPGGPSTPAPGDGSVRAPACRVRGIGLQGAGRRPAG